MRSERSTTGYVFPLARIGLITTLAIAGVAVAPVYVAAQCAFNFPTGTTTYTGYLSTSLVRAFVSCGNPGGNSPNGTGAGGVPSCAPPETFAEQDGSPSNGWQFHTGTSYGRVRIKRNSGGANASGFPPTLRDAAITLKMFHIGRSDGGGFATGNGTLAIVFRATFNDYTFGDMTYVDFPAGFPIHLVAGTVSMTTKVGDLLVGIGQPRFPDCTSLEVVSIAVVDPNGNTFAVSGVKFP